MAVVVLVIVDVLLVALALARTAPSSNGTTGPVPTFSNTPMPMSTPSTSVKPSGSATADPAGMVAPARRLLSAVDSLEAWRASSGMCDGTDGVLEHTVDGGATWTRVDLGTETGAVLALRAGNATISVIVGTGDECTPTVQTSTDDGVTWQPGMVGAAGAGIGPDGLILSSGTVDSPCADPVEAFQGERTTAVVCDGAVQWRTGSSAWVEVPVKGVRSLAVNGSSYTLARSGADVCDGVQIVSIPASGVTAATTVTPLGCADDTDGDDPIVLTRAGADVWLWAGDDVLVSSDGGVTW
ncbi:hypothetical protein EDF28_1181 [Curtobacterium sp. PhB137]|uniref:WD40/YVTN/BNR-like repeat-containing protein n=1 Tax=Curtobacterium sp. PhB137 TaxID=2485182 RepID=UPI000FBB5152|nr:hypothetical protein [Curtobacterium sp. PhB137]RPE85236.1 hypothetical protein EDF28_1181 [Curtobacterium sp. PhB137]